MEAGAHFGYCIRLLGPSEEIQICLLVCLLFAEWLLYMCLFCNDLFFPLLLLLPAITPFWNAVFLRAYFFFLIAFSRCWLCVSYRFLVFVGPFPMLFNDDPTPSLETMYHATRNTSLSGPLVFVLPNNI